jgi:ABC-type transport system substrate-binding protein
MSVLAQQYWKALGAEVTIKEVDRQVYGTILLAHTFDINISNTPSSWDPDTQRRFYLSDAGSNFGQYANPKADDLMKRGVAEVDITKRKAIYKEFQEFTYDDLNVLHGYFPTELRVTSKKLKGLPELPLRDVMTYMDSWYLEK